MKYKMIYGSKDDDFIWKMIPTYSPLEKLHLRLAKWHLRKLIKVDKEILDKLWLECYNSIIKEKLEDPFNVHKIDEKEIEKIIDKINDVPFVNPMPKEDLERTLDDWKRYPLWNTEPMCNAIVKLEGDEDEVK